MLFTSVWLDDYGVHTGCHCTGTICTCYGADVADGTATATTGNRIVVVIDRYDRYDREPFPEIKAEVRLAREYDPPPRYCAVDASRLRRTRSPLLGFCITKAVPAGRERGHSVGHSPRVRSRHGG